MIQNIWCVGRNYADHAKELGNAVPEKPMIFLKAGSCAVESGQPLRFPSWLGTIHHEVEMALIFDEHLEISQAAVALDLTARDLQTQLKKQSYPWTLAKSFPQACPLGSRFAIKNLSELQSRGQIQLFINEELRQNGNFRDMVFPVNQLVDYLRSHLPVMPGDLLMTGTPAGVGPLEPGDLIHAEIVGLSEGRWKVE